jgi:murein DD-endopeptidase MepM/ murein hydrolase activator NlpD
MSGSRKTALLLLLPGLLALLACRSGRAVSVTGHIPSGWPVEQRIAHISSGFGPRSGGLHQGIDLAAPHGAPVVATADGEVVLAGRKKRYGRIVVINHGAGYETRYAHLSRISVRVGERVRRGQRIGRVGKSGNASGSHLHYEVRRSDVAIDPSLYLGQ